MRFENAFDVQAPIDEVYTTLLDIERVGPCMPGAEVLEKVSDSAYKVAVKVKLGPISMQYRGDVEIIERDDAAHRAVLSIKAREARGQGTADATATMELAGDEQATHVTLTTEVQLSGKAAAMGQGVIQDVSARLVDQFAANLAAMLEATPAAEAEQGESAATGAPAATAPPQTPPPAAEALDAGDLAGAVIASRLRDPKTLAALGGLALALVWLVRRLRG